MVYNKHVHVTLKLILFFFLHSKFTIFFESEQLRDLVKLSRSFILCNFLIPDIVRISPFSNKIFIFPIR